jgi:hypothetical protein
MAAEAAEIIHNMCLWSGDGFPNVLVVYHDSKFTSKVFWAFVKSMGSCLVVGSAYHKNTNAKVEWANGVISDTLCTDANGHRDDWDRQLPLAVFAINNVASTLGDGLTPFFISKGLHPRLPDGPCSQPPRRRVTGTLCAADALAGAAGERALGGGIAGEEGEAGRGPGAAADQGAARRCGQRQAAAEVGRAFQSNCLP